MKALILISLVTLSMVVMGESKTVCDFNGDKGIDTISIISSKSFPYQNKPETRGRVEINYINGDRETLMPQPLIEGSFDQVIYPDNIASWKIRPKDRSFVFVKSRIAGDTKISFTCGDRSVFCIPRGSGNTGAIADFNIAGKKYHFNRTTNTCSFEHL